MDAGNSRSFTSGSSIANNIALTKASNQTGSLINATQYNSDGGGCWQFDGSDDRIDCDTFTNIVGAGSLANYTIEVWVKSDGAPTNYDLVFGSKTSVFDSGGYSMLCLAHLGYMADGIWRGGPRIYPETDIQDYENWNNMIITYLR